MNSSVGYKTVTTADLVTEYIDAYAKVNGWKPRIEYKGNGWYQVDEEIIHRSTLLQEIGRLRKIQRQKELEETQAAALNYEAQRKKSLISKLISRLRKL
jgi:hypothetical protein